MEKTISEKLLDIQMQLKAPKNNINKFGGYSYRSCEDILEAVKFLLKETGTILILTDDVVMIGNRYYIKATAILRDTKTNEEIKNVAYARESENKKGMDDSQVTGTASSYARKYALNGLFCIDDVKDADANEYTETTQAKNTNKKVEIKTKEEAGAYKLNFGKYAGKTILEIINTNQDYAGWLLKNGDDTVKKCLQFFIAKKEETIQKDDLPF